MVSEPLVALPVGCTPPTAACRPRLSIADRLLLDHFRTNNGVNLVLWPFLAPAICKVLGMENYMRVIDHVLLFSSGALLLNKRVSIHPYLYLVRLAVVSSGVAGGLFWSKGSVFSWGISR